MTRAEAVNPALNAIVTPVLRGRAQAQRGPADGCARGRARSCSRTCSSTTRACRRARATGPSSALRWTPHEHAEITRRWLAGGLVPFGMTNTPEFGAKGITEPDAWGPTRNPWHSAHTPGGSSGGSAAAVAAGIVPAAGAQRRWRLDPHSCRVHRPVRAQAGPRSHPQRTAAWRADARRCHAPRAHAQRARQRGDCST